MLIFKYLDPSQAERAVFSRIMYENVNMGLEPHMGRRSVLNDSVWVGAKNLDQDVLLPVCCELL